MRDVYVAGIGVTTFTRLEYALSEIASYASMMALKDACVTEVDDVYVANMGGAMTLAAISVPEARFDEVADLVNAYVEVAHNYRRDHRINMWFVVACETPQEVAAVLADIELRTGLPVLDLPKEEEFFLELKLSA